VDSLVAVEGGSVSRLELKVAPDVVWVIVAAVMWFASGRTPRVDLPDPLRVGIAIALTGAGVWAMVSARIALERADTTWHPTTPSKSTHLVTSGVFGLSRNPIYLGMLLVMIGFAVLLASPVALLLCAVFLLYIGRFQIVPEERALGQLLGQEYEDYLARVRRWI
jgi:protein-S-isoprenylcysteine O-methyltransferase Ste14